MTLSSGRNQSSKRSSKKDKIDAPKRTHSYLVHNHQGGKKQNNKMIRQPMLVIFSSLLLLLFLTTLSILPAVKAVSKGGGRKNLPQFPLIPYHHEKERRRRNLLLESSPNNSDVIQMDALYQGYGTHYVDLWVGTPPQRQTLIVGTDSHIAGFPCSSCDDCGGNGLYHTDKSFDERDSSSFEKVGCNECETSTFCKPSDTNYGCDMHVSYQEGSSWYAYEAKDIVYAGGPHNQSLLHDDHSDSDIDPFRAVKFSFHFLFGCQTKLTGLFKTQMADGILGMNKNKASFWSQLYEQELLPEKSYSLCFTRQDIAERGGTEAGAMTLGGYDDRLHETPILFTPMGTEERQFRAFDVENFHVHIRKIYLRDGTGGERAKNENTEAKLIELDTNESAINFHPVMIGSGTTDTYLPKAIDAVFKNTFYELTGKSYNHDSTMMTESEVRALPTLILQLSGDAVYNRQIYPDLTHLPETAAAPLDPEHPYDVLLVIPPSHYMEKHKDSQVYTARIYTDDYGTPVLGANGMMGHDIYFDVEGQRIGWAESNCDYHHLLSENGFDENVDKSGGGKKKEQSQDNEKEQSATTTKSHKVQNKEKIEPRTAKTTTGENTIRNTVLGAIIGSMTVVALGLFSLRIFRNNRTVYRAVGPMESEMRDLSLVEEDHFPMDRRQYEISATTNNGSLPAVS